MGADDRVLDPADYGSPRWSAEIADCAFPMTLDTYSNCAFDCVYCFSQFQRGVGGAADNYLAKVVKSVHIDRIRRIFTHPESSQFEQFVRERRAIQWGGLSDQFDDNERQFGKTLELLHLFRELKWPITFSTKATWWAFDKRYQDVFADMPWNVKFSIITLDSAKAALIEQGVPSPQERLSAMRVAAGFCGAGVTLRFRPFIIGVSNPGHVELIEAAAEAGAGAVSTEFMCVETRSARLRDRGLTAMSVAAGFDIYEYYRRYSRGAGYLRLNRNVKRPFVDEMQEACKRLKMRFYVSDAHFKERCNNGCCCGLPESFPYSRGQWTEALQIAKRTGSIRWSEIASNLGFAKTLYFGRMAGYNTNSTENRTKYRGKTMFDVLRSLWNSPERGNSPYRLYDGILRPVGTDESGDVIYEYDASRA